MAKRPAGVRQRTLTMRVGRIKVKFTPPSKRGLFDAEREIGEEMGIPFPLTGSGPWSIDVFNEWVRQIGLAFIGHHPAHNRCTGRPPGRVASYPAKTKEAKKQRAKRARKRQHDDQMKAAYLAWYKDRYGGS